MGLPAQVADVLSSDKFYSDMFDGAAGDGCAGAREVANLITTDLMGLAATREQRAASRATPAHLRDLAAAVASGSITMASAKDALHEIVRSGRPVAEIVKERGMRAVGGGAELARAVSGVLAAEPAAAKQARSDPKAVNYLVGKVMKATAGRADPQQAIRLIREELAGGDAAGSGAQAGGQ